MQVRVTSPVEEPQARDLVWGGREVVAALTFSPGHWVTYLRHQGVWWRVDSAAGGTVVQASPFGDQNNRITIDVLAFRR